MKLVLLVHPTTLTSNSMPRFARMIGEGMHARGHDVEYWTSARLFSRFPVIHAGVRKWLGYVDQYLIYPPRLAARVSRESANTLFVVADQALGMWIPRIAHRPHVIHCHDFLALRSALGEVPENPTSSTGKLYQGLIRNGFCHGNCFLSVSEKTKSDLRRFLKHDPLISEMVYNGLNEDFGPMARKDACESLKGRLANGDVAGVVLHVGSGTWYKNRRGVIEIYQQWCRQTAQAVLPLWMVGPAPTDDLRRLAESTERGGQIRFLSDLSHQELQAAYALARLFLFPSLDEGFGWPIAEALACGTPVLTTMEAPMTEVGGDAAFYLRRRPQVDPVAWAREGARIVEQILSMNVGQRETIVSAGLAHSKRFDAQAALDQYEAFYRRVLELHLAAHDTRRKETATCSTGKS